ncbi:hypothetical protein K1T71_012263 [Dendrolimus kikuchii]|uniref:Uncharacterized protein n=1 Tax=Dendrolimus kikuchii TaxID=765133 RepID=A0ACC1CL45_9NEOP|nr:hypothetical protein K1T71_012263 [Dendrolimus kikuchii]
MAWFADLAGKAESLLNNLDEQTGVALRNHNVLKSRKYDHNDYALPPEPVLSKKRPIPRNLKKITPILDTRNNLVPSRKTSPTQHSRSQIKDSLQNIKNGVVRPRRSPTRKSNPQYSLNNCPNTLVGDIDTEFEVNEYGLRQRRYSLPMDLEIINNENWAYKLQNLEVENAMLKNELNVMNREVADLLDRLRKTEDGNELVEVVCTQELSKTHMKLQNTEILNNTANEENKSLTTQMKQLKQRINEITILEITKYKDLNQGLEIEVSLLRDRNKDLEEKLNEYTDNIKEKETNQKRLETELRHAQSNISELQSALDKSTGECKRLEKDWETYKLRVKSMLHSKDDEIKSLQNGRNFTEDSKVLMEQLESLREERDELAEAISRVQNESSEMKHYVDQLETKHDTAERVVTALREALKDERAARNRAESQCFAISKELKTFQIETGQTITSLRIALRDKEHELNNLHESTSSIKSTDTSALNVADYDVQDSIDNDKINCLTNTLIQRQGKIDSLLADNNMLRIQLEKLESKYKTELTQVRGNHSVVHLQDTECRTRSRNHNQDSALSTLSMRIGVMFKRYPFFRILIIIYMIGLHFWVLTVLLNSTPSDYLPRSTKL